MAKKQISARRVHFNKNILQRSSAAIIESLETRVFLSAVANLYVAKTPTRVVAQSTQELVSNLVIADSDQSYDGTVSLSLSGSNPGTLSGTLSAPAPGSFWNLVFSAPGNYTLTATDDRGDTPVTFTIDNVLPPTAADHLVVIQQPTLDPATGGCDMEFQLQNPLGNGVAGDPNDPTSEVSLTTLHSSVANFPGGLLNINALPDANGFITLDNIGVTSSGSYSFELSSYTENVAPITTQAITLAASSGGTFTAPLGSHLEYRGVSFESPTNGIFSVWGQLVDSLGNPIEGNVLGNDHFTVNIQSGPDGAVLTDDGPRDLSWENVQAPFIEGLAVSKPGIYTFNIVDETTGQSAVTTPILLTTPDLTPIPASAYAGLHLASGVADNGNGVLALQLHWADSAGDSVPDQTLATSGEISVKINSGPAGAVLQTITDPLAPENNQIGETSGYASIDTYAVSVGGTYTFEIDDSAAGISSITDSVVLYTPTTPLPVSQPTPLPAPGAPQYSILQQPTLDSNDGACTLKVSMEDSQGNPLPGNSNDPASYLSVSLATGPSGAKLWGNLTTPSDANGVTTFWIAATVAGDYMFKITDSNMNTLLVSAQITLPAFAQPTGIQSTGPILVGPLPPAPTSVLSGPVQAWVISDITPTQEPIAFPSPTVPSTTTATLINQPPPKTTVTTGTTTPTPKPTVTQSVFATANPIATPTLATSEWIASATAQLIFGAVTTNTLFSQQPVDTSTDIDSLLH